jgi:hypothetical protein
MSSKVAARRGAWQSDRTASGLATAELQPTGPSPLAIPEAPAEAPTAEAKADPEPSKVEPATPRPPTYLESLDEQGLRTLIRSVVEEALDARVAPRVPPRPSRIATRLGLGAPSPEGDPK